MLITILILAIASSGQMVQASTPKINRTADSNIEIQNPESKPCRRTGNELGREALRVLDISLVFYSIVAFSKPAFSTLYFL